eukprot:m.30156 g.30156  ORF g.30156 m.30156 type:complete len:465 (-) comp9617_c1_seq2:847-2241(-)
MISNICSKLKEEVNFTPLLIDADNNNFLLFSAALPLLYSHNEETSLFSHETVRDCCSLSSVEASNIIASSPSLANELTHRLTELFVALPRELDSSSDALINYISKVLRREATRLKWEKLGSISVGYHADVVPLARFLAEFSFYDELCATANEFIVENLCNSFISSFLQPIFQPKLLSGSESEVDTVTTLLTTMLVFVRSKGLVDAISRFALNDTLLNTFIARCDDMSDTLSVTTMNFFGVLLDHHHEHVYTRLIRSHMATDSEWNDVKTPKYVTDFLSDVVPMQLRTSTDENAGREYFEHSLRKMVVVTRDCSEWTVSLSSDDEANDALNTCDSDFLSLLLKKLSRVFSQDTNINALVTELIGKLLMFPSKKLRSYILSEHKNALLPVLSKLREEMDCAYVRSDGMEDKLAFVRSEMQIGHTNLLMISDDDSVQLYEGIILLEEFVKELTAIVLIGANPVVLEI